MYSEDDFEINIQAQSIKYLIRTLLTFKSKDPSSQVSDISVKVMNPSHLASSYLIECSPVRY